MLWLAIGSVALVGLLCLRDGPRHGWGRAATGGAAIATSGAALLLFKHDSDAAKVLPWANAAIILFTLGHPLLMMDRLFESKELTEREGKLGCLGQAAFIITIIVVATIVVWREPD